MARIVVALGGNALSRAGEDGTWEEARRHVRETTGTLAALVARGEELVITHGNGPQVGALLLQQDAARREVPALPMDAVGAMTQGWIGYLLEQELRRSFQRRRLTADVLSLVTQTLVDPRDPAFRTPTKPVGRYYPENEARLLAKQKGWVLREDAARGGWRRIVPSPRPKEIVELPLLRRILDGGRRHPVVAIVAGGGGIPVVRDGQGVIGVEAVIDKDRTAALLARGLRAETLAIVTDVRAVSVGFHTPRERALGAVGAEALARHLAEGEFGEGSMRPKVEAALDFVQHGGRRALITDVPSLPAALRGRAGTQVTQAAPRRAR